MKSFYFLLAASFFPLFIFAQLNEDFSDGNLDQNPTWQGDVGLYIVNPDLELQLNATSAGAAQIQTQVSIPDSTIWEIKLKLDFAPSTSNLCQIFLQLTDPSPVNSNGYFLQIGETGSDDALRFYRLDNGRPQLVASGTLGTFANAPAMARIRVTRSNIGDWTISADYSTGTDFQQEASFNDNTYQGGNLFFGIRSNYTNSRIDKFFYDDITIAPLIPDQTPPTLTRAEAINETQVDIFFNESVDPTTAQNPANYQIDNGIGTPTMASVDINNAQLVHLSLSNALQNQQSYTLTSNAIADLAGNSSNSQSAAFNFIKSETAGSLDILINEIMADPTPQLGLPNAEFVEIYNTSDKIINLKDHVFGDPSKQITLPDFLFFPGEYLVLHNAGSEFDIFGDNLNLGDFPALTNSGDQIRLVAPDGTIIHQVDYTDQWYTDNSKSQGGWTLELINPEGPCKAASNWQASTDPKGGTPGQVNSVFDPSPDRTAPILVRAFPLSPSEIQLIFDKSLDLQNASETTNYDLENNNIIDAVIAANTPNVVNLTLANDLVPSEVVTLSILVNLTDCIGNAISNTTVDIALPEQASSFDIVINEILFDPETGGKRFVELFNRSTKIIDLSSLIIAQRDTSNQITNAFPITTNYLLFPDQYVVITESPADIEERYQVENPQALIRDQLPTYASNGGVVVIYTIDGNETVIVDEFMYLDDFHHPFLDDEEGVSLERIDPNATTQMTSNWQSAASDVGYATPTYQNSQARTTTAPVTDNTFSIVNPRLSPNEDGFEDFLLIDYEANQPSPTANIKIFDSEGRLIKNLVRNELLATSGSFKWEGDTDEGGKARMGIYVIWMETISPDGKVNRKKEVCVLAKNLD